MKEKFLLFSICAWLLPIAADVLQDSVLSSTVQIIPGITYEESPVKYVHYIDSLLAIQETQIRRIGEKGAQISIVSLATRAGLGIRVTVEDDDCSLRPSGLAAASHEYKNAPYDKLLLYIDSSSSESIKELPKDELWGGGHYGFSATKNTKTIVCDLRADTFNVNYISKLYEDFAKDIIPFNKSEPRSAVDFNLPWGLSTKKGDHTYCFMFFLQWHWFNGFYDISNVSDEILINMEYAFSFVYWDWNPSLENGNRLSLIRNEPFDDLGDQGELLYSWGDIHIQKESEIKYPYRLYYMNTDATILRSGSFDLLGRKVTNQAHLIPFRILKRQLSR